MPRRGFYCLLICISGLWFADSLRAVPDARAAPIYPANTLLSPDKENDLFDSIDLSGDGLKAIREALERKDYASAQHLLADYFRHRTTVPWKFGPQMDPSVVFDKKVADDTVNGRVQGGVLPIWYSFPDGKIDWLFNVTFDGKMARNSEWQWQLCRMAFWNDLGKAYRATGDEHYAKAWAQQLRSFIAECPPSEQKGKFDISAWRTIEAGIRMSGSWPNAYHSFLRSPSITDEDLLLYVYGSLLHGRFLEKFNTGGNWLTMEMCGLYTVGAVFPEFKQAAEWRNYAMGRMFALEKTQFLPDGAHEELSTGYHNVAMDNITGLMDIARLVGRGNELPAGFIDPMEKAYNFDMLMSAPDGQVPQFNDSWHSHVSGFLKRALQYFPNRKDYLWFATDGKEGQPPVETSHAFDWAGFYVMRFAWAPDANFLILRAGPLGASHAHQDKLTLVMWAYGRELLFNSGGGPYDRSAFRSYSVDTFSHNTVLVDGLSQHRDPKDREANLSHAPINSRWETAPDHDFVEGVYDEAYGYKGQHPATHFRRVLFLKPDLAIVFDKLTPHDAASHTYQARWNLLTTKTQKNDVTGEVMTEDPNQPNLDIVPLQLAGLEVKSASAQTTPEILGWNVIHSGAAAEPATTVLQTRKGTGVQTFLTLLVPVKARMPNPIKSVQVTSAGASQAIFTDGRTLTIVASADPAGGLEATETLADGSPGRHVKAGGGATAPTVASPKSPQSP